MAKATPVTPPTQAPNDSGQAPSLDGKSRPAGDQVKPEKPSVSVLSMFFF